MGYAQICLCLFTSGGALINQADEHFSHFVTLRRYKKSITFEGKALGLLPQLLTVGFLIPAYCEKPKMLKTERSLIRPFVVTVQR